MLKKGKNKMADPTRQLAIEKFSRCIKDRLSTNVREVRCLVQKLGEPIPQNQTLSSFVLVESDDRITSDNVMDIVVDVNLEYDVVISPIIMASSHYYANQLFRETAFFHALELEGVSLMVMLFSGRQENRPLVSANPFISPL